MTQSDPRLDELRDPRLAPHIASPFPAWLFGIDPVELLWANACGAAALGASGSPRAEPRPAAVAAFAAHVVRLAASLPAAERPRLERLRGIGGGIGRGVVCRCTRLSLGNGVAAILIAAEEPLGPVLPVGERVRRAFARLSGPFAVFSADGELLHATADAIARLGGATTLAAFGAALLRDQALDRGAAHGDTKAGAIDVERLGAGPSSLLLARFADSLSETASPAPTTAAAVAGSITPPPVPADSGAPLPAAAARPQKLPERRHALRFVWQMDLDGRFTLGSDEFARMIGPEAAEILGRPWVEIAHRLGLDPEHRIERAVKSRDTWSGIVVQWPIEGAGERAPVELSGLPIFDHQRQFRGYRGFGICRGALRLVAATAEQQPAAGPNIGSRHAGDAGAPPLSDTARTAAPAADRPAPPAGEARPHLTVVPASKNVVPFRAAGAATGDKRVTLTAIERTAFREIAKVLGASPEGRGQKPPDDDPLHAPPGSEHAGVHDPVEAIEEGKPAGEPGPPWSAGVSGPDRPAGVPDQRLPSVERALRHAEAEARELRSILDTATDGVIVLERDGRIVSVNRSAEALFAYEAHELAGRPFVDLFAPESHRSALDYLDGLALNGVASVLNDGREVIGQVRQGGLIPLFMTMGRVAGGSGKFCAVFRDITQWKRAEEDLVNARRRAEQASSAKSDFLAKISHEIRTPLNAIIGFSEVMSDERFGPIGNDRYREYLKDIQASGSHLVSLVNDLLDLSKIEAGKLDLTFSSVNLNELVQQCVAIMQPQANRQRIIIRTSLSPMLPPVVVDARSIRQIMLNLLSNSVKFTAVGGQVIVSTTLTERGEAVMRVRDTGVGMSEEEVETALEPFRQLAASERWGSGGTGLGLPLAKALAEANRATFAIRSAVNAGTVVEITFPATRVLAE